VAVGSPNERPSHAASIELLPEGDIRQRSLSHVAFEDHMIALARKIGQQNRGEALATSGIQSSNAVALRQSSLSTWMRIRPPQDSPTR
jgi:hypothetical protein